MWDYYHEKINFEWNTSLFTKKKFRFDDVFQRHVISWEVEEKHLFSLTSHATIFWEDECNVIFWEDECNVCQDKRMNG